MFNVTPAEVHVKNSSDNPLAVTVLDENQSTRHTSQAHVLLAPNGETTVGSEDGLNMQSGDQVHGAQFRIQRSHGHGTVSFKPAAFVPERQPRLDPRRRDARPGEDDR